MANKPLYGLTEERYQSLLAIERDYKAGLLGGRKSSDQSTSVDSAFRMVCLLSDIESFGAGRAVLLRAHERPAGYVKTIWIVGHAGRPGEGIHLFRITINNRTTPEMSIFMSAAELKKQLADIGYERGVNVTLGRTVDDGKTLYPLRWFLDFDPAVYERPPAVTVQGGLALYRPRIANSPYQIGPVVDVKSVIPTGYPTPLRTGSIAVISRLWGIGWGIMGIEPRMFDSWVEDL